MKKLKKLIIGVSMLGAVVGFVPACSNSIKFSEEVIEEDTSIEDTTDAEESKIDNSRYIWGHTGNNDRGGGGGTRNTSSFS